MDDLKNEKLNEDKHREKILRKYRHFLSKIFKNNLFKFLMALYITVFFILMFFGTEKFKGLIENSDLKLFSLIVVISFSIIELFGSTLKYLDVEDNLDNIKKSNEKDFSFFEETKKELKREIIWEFSKLNENINKLKNEYQSIKLNDKSSNDLIKGFTETFNEEMKDKLIATFKEDFLPNLIINEKYKHIFLDFEQSKNRLGNEIKVLSKRANLNLTIGIFSTLIAIGLLWYTIWSIDTEFKDIIAFLKLIIPRITLIILVEIFAFFFLKLYKISLTDIKYYQNEFTNVEFKILAYKANILNENVELHKEIILSYLNVERNLIQNPIDKKVSNSDKNEKINIEVINELLKNIKNIFAPK